MKILIAYYSMYGHTLQMAKAVEGGAASANGTEAVLRRIAEFPDVEKEIENNKFAKQVWSQQKNVPVCTLDDLP